MTRVAAVSDLHGHLPEVPPSDLLILSGDLCPATNHSPAFQAAWLDGPFRRWLDAVPAKEVVGVAGNHDWVFQTHPGLVPGGLRWTYLQDSGTEAAGLRVYGSPWQKRFHDWAFNADSHELEVRWAAIPDDTQVLVLHGPPYGYGDAAPRSGGGVELTGCPALTRRILSLRDLRLCCYGHIHSGRGTYQIGGVVAANVAHVDERYRPVYPVVTFEI